MTMGRCAPLLWKRDLHTAGIYKLNQSLKKPASEAGETNVKKNVKAPLTPMVKRAFDRIFIVIKKTFQLWEVPPIQPNTSILLGQ